MVNTSTTALDVVRNARQLYRTYRDTATRPSKVRNLDLLWEVLATIRDEGSRDYSLAEIGRRLETMGGPKTQSLRNAQGAYLREIIIAYASAVNGSTRYIGATKSNVEQALELVTDPSIRATLRIAIEEAKRLKVVNDNLHAAFKNLQVGASLPSAPAIEPDGTSPATSAPVPIAQAPALTPRLRLALLKGIDETRLAQQGLLIGDDGSIRNEAGDTVFPPSFVLAIQVALAADGGPDGSIGRSPLTADRLDVRLGQKGEGAS